MNTKSREKLKNYFFRLAVKQNQKSLSDLRMFLSNYRADKGVSDNSDLRKGVTGKSSDLNLVTTPPCPPPTGEILHEMAIQSFESGSPSGSTKAQAIEGGKSNFYETTSNSNSSNEELNISVVAGRWFDLIYDKADNPLLIQTSTCSLFYSLIPIPEHGQDVRVTIKTNADIIPQDAEMYYYVDRGNENINFAGVTLDLNTSAGYVGADGQAHGTNVIQTAGMINVNRSLGMGDIDDISKSVQICNSFILPAGILEIGYFVYISGIAYTSNDFIPVTNDTGTYAIALLDLRNRINGRQYPILRDPLQSWDKQPYGGVRIMVTMEISSLP